MPEQRPTVGRPVHYVSHGSPVRADGAQAYEPQCRAAIVTEVGAWLDVTVTPGSPDSTARATRTVDQAFDVTAVHLAVLNPTGEFFRACEYDPGSVDGDGPRPPLCTGLHHEGGTWHWPVTDARRDG